MKSTLLDLLKVINDWVKFAEAKNAGTIAFSSALIFGLIKAAGGLEIDFFRYACYIMVGVGAIALGLAFMSFSPITDKHFQHEIKDAGSFSNVYYFGDIKNFRDHKKGIDYKAYLRIFYEKSGNAYIENKLEQDIAIQLINNSGIAYRKLKLFKIILRVYLGGIIAALIGASFLAIFLPHASS